VPIIVKYVDNVIFVSALRLIGLAFKAAQHWNFDDSREVKLVSLLAFTSERSNLARSPKARHWVQFLMNLYAYFESFYSYFKQFNI